jgi:hypothetical protein
MIVKYDHYNDILLFTVLELPKMCVKVINHMLDSSMYNFIVGAKQV